jgi:histidinol dehydrogenase
MGGEETPATRLTERAKMPITLDTSVSDFAARFETFLGSKREASEDVDAAAREILRGVESRGDEALIEYSKKFDRVDLKAETIRITADEIEAAFKSADKKTLEALEFAKNRIEAHHKKQVPQDQRYTDPLGVELGYRWSALESVGIYVPGGKAAYPSSVLMNAIPAVVAGVPRIAMCVPAPDGVINPLVLVAAKLAGVTEIYRVGGAQAIAALAYGTKTIAPVAKIVGPGNAYVAAAKRLVFGRVGIDMVAGPSEVLVIADAGANPDWIAADLLAQAEHDEAAQSILMTDSRELADQVTKAVASQLKSLPRERIASESWKNFGAIILLKNLSEAPALADRIAAEHLELLTADAEGLMKKIRNAGAFFIGQYTPEAIGDYVGGSNHVLPTARAARYASGLGVLDFMKRSSVLKLEAEQLRALGGAAMALGEAEGLQAHARSISIRLNRD